MANRFLPLVFLLLAFSWQKVPEKLNFQELMSLQFEEVFNSEKEKWEYLPKFSKHLMELNGTEVTLKGYVIPMDLEGVNFALSAYPFSSCFFCGGAGPESVVELVLDKPKKYKTDQIVTFKGKFIISDQINTSFFYTLESAEELKK